MILKSGFLQKAKLKPPHDLFKYRLVLIIGDKRHGLTEPNFDIFLLWYFKGCTPTIIGDLKAFTMNYYLAVL